MATRGFGSENRVQGDIQIQDVQKPNNIHHYLTKYLSLYIPTLTEVPYMLCRLQHTLHVGILPGDTVTITTAEFHIAHDRERGFTIHRSAARATMWALKGDIQRKVPGQ